MKTLLITLSLSILSFAFKSDTKGNFTIDGKTYNGKVSTQTFTNKNFSVLCEWEDKSSSDYNKWKYELFQITFHNEAEATKGGTFKINSSQAINTSTGTVTLGGFDGMAFLFAENDKSSTLTVSNKTIKINNVKVYKLPAPRLKEDKNYMINSATIAFE
jgi:hypothetical protein